MSTAKAVIFVLFLALLGAVNQKMFWNVHTVLYSSLKFSGLNFRQSLGLETNYKFFGYGQSCLSDCKQFEINVRTRCTSRNSGFSKSTCRD